jgi:hypothetical protein
MANGPASFAVPTLPFAITMLAEQHNAKIAAK